MRLYSYWRSSASYRVRIALNIKGLEYETVPVNLLKDGGEQHGPAFRAVNALGRVPVLVDGSLTISQSMAIIEYLEETRPEPRILPAGAAARALARQLAFTIACDVHPLNNSGVLRYLSEELGVAEPGRSAWYRHWIAGGFHALEAMLANGSRSGAYCLGPEVTIADICLIPQLYNARRFEVPLDAYPILRAIEDACLRLDAFELARPERQPDVP